MFIKQLSLFLENRPGALEELTTLLGDNAIDLIALSIADTTDFGIVRAIVNDSEAALSLVKARGYTASLTEVLAVAVQDKPGGLATALRLLREGGVSIEYLYSFVRRVDHHAVIIFRVDAPENAARILQDAHYRLLAQGEIS